MRFAFRIEQDVSRLDITMQNSMFMRVMNGACDVRDQLRRAPNRHRLAPGHFVELSAFDEFHAEVARAIALAYFVDSNDAGMLQVSCRFGFETETFQVRFAGPLAEANDF